MSHKNKYASKVVTLIVGVNLFIKKNICRRFIVLTVGVSYTCEALDLTEKFTTLKQRIDDMENE